jgi:hypothetical protein
MSLKSSQNQGINAEDTTTSQQLLMQIFALLANMGYVVRLLFHFLVFSLISPASHLFCCHSLQ